MKEKKICPRCGQPGSGPYGRWAKKPQFRPYFYFAHKINGRLSWCYIGKLSNSAPKLSNSCTAGDVDAGIMGQDKVETLTAEKKILEWEAARLQRKYDPNLKRLTNPELSHPSGRVGKNQEDSETLTYKEAAKIHGKLRW